MVAGTGASGILLRATRVNPDAVWNGSFLPAKAELNVLPPARK